MKNGYNNGNKIKAPKKKPRYLYKALVRIKIKPI